MLIISKFHDYYDSAVGEGIDKTIIYKREENQVKIPDLGVDISWKGLHIFSGKFFNKKNKEIGFHTWLSIGFCGKIYVCLKEELYELDGLKKIDIQENFYYGLDCLIPFEKCKDKKFTWKDDGKYKDTKEYINKLHEKEFPELFFEYKSPIFLITNYTERGKNKTCIINSQLKQIEFFKQKGSFTAFQEIQSFISGVLGVNREPEIILTDKDKIISHGFDLKTSFRNM